MEIKSILVVRKRYTRTCTVHMYVCTMYIRVYSVNQLSETCIQYLERIY